jgi:CO dehydrogenase/acetyl-CoA synthase beta subunit
LESLDSYIGAVREYVDALSAASRVTVFDCPTDGPTATTGLPVRLGRQRDNNIILKEDTAVELGNPSVASCAFVLWTPDRSLVRDGRITLVGPDIPESVGESLPFAQVLLVAGAGLKEHHHLVFEQHHALASQIEGYMVRLAPQQQRMWTRVSRDVVRRGFSFATLGQAIMVIYKSRLPAIDAVEVLFITSSAKDVQGLEPLASDVRKARAAALSRRFSRKDDGSYECTSSYTDCTVCPDQDTCDDIRDLIRLRQKKGPARSQPGAPN